MSLLHTVKLPRKPELDALRGLFLVWMTLAHLPTRMSDVVNQPFGFLSSAEGFVFLSALLVGRIYVRQAEADYTSLRVKLFKRSLRVYGYHLVMLLLVFTLAASFAVYTHRPALYNLLHYYIAHPAVAIVGSLLLIYCPPLLDILPMYVLFLLLSPLVLHVAVRRGWRPVLIASWGVWLAAQFGLREYAHNFVVHLTHLPIPLQETGAFDLFAWQWVWIMGMWLGGKSATTGMPLRFVPRWGVALSGAVCAFFIGVRHGWLGLHLNQSALGMHLDKWHVGPLRALNLMAFAVLAYWGRALVKKVVEREPLLTLGKASLEVFCAHLVFVFAGLALLYDDVQQLHGWRALALLIGTMLGLIAVASYYARKRRREAMASSSKGPAIEALEAWKREGRDGEEAETLTTRGEPARVTSLP